MYSYFPTFVSNMDGREFINSAGADASSTKIRRQFFIINFISPLLVVGSMKLLHTAS